MAWGKNDNTFNFQIFRELQQPSFWNLLHNMTSKLNTLLLNFSILDKKNAIVFNISSQKMQYRKFKWPN